MIIKKQFQKVWYIGERLFYYFESYYSTLGWISSDYPTGIIEFAQKNYTAFYIDEADISMQKRVWRRAFRNPKWLENKEKSFNNLRRRLVRILKSLNVAGLSNKDLFIVYSEIINFYFLYQGEYNIIARLLDRYGIEILRKKLEAVGIKNKDRENVITILTAPQKESYLAREERKFWQGILGLHSPNKINSFFGQHLQQFAYVGRSYFDSHPLTKKHLEKRLVSYPKNEWPKKSLESPVSIEKNISQRKKLLANKKISHQIKKSATVLQKATHLKDSIRGCLAEVYHHSNPVFKELAKRTGLRVWQLKSLNIEEVETIFLKNEKADKNILKKRFFGTYLVLPVGKAVKVLYGKKALTFKKKYLERTYEEDKLELEGRPVSSGKVTGLVRVVHNLEEAKSLKTGEILVVSNTNPAFIPYLKGVSAIIAEEGGVTVHAAIVSRELRIPCIIGINSARKLFRTGDRIEVDANQGIVRKLKQKA